MTIRVLIADDHPLVRMGIRQALKAVEGIEVVGEAGDGEEALRLIEHLRPDVALLDSRLPQGPGARVAAAVQAQGLPVRVLALSAYLEDEDLYGMLEAGVVGYLLKEEGPEVVAAAVQAVARGETWYSQAVMGKVVAWAQGKKRSPVEVVGLTDREVQVLRLVAQGWDNRRIARALGISEGTVKNHVTHIYAKLGVRSRAEAVAWAWEHRVIGG